MLAAFFTLLVIFTGLLVLNAALLSFHRLLTAHAENTGLLNRRGFFPQAEKIYAHNLLPPYELAAQMMDIDHFKQVHDHYGHQVGDVVLQEVIARIHDNLRPTDLVARYGGEEFVAMLPRISRATLSQITQRLNAVAREQPVTYNGTDISITISIGATILTGANYSLDEFLSQADQSMYQAKAVERN